MAGNPQTLQTVLNRVLVSLREPTITSGTTVLTDAYQLLLLEFFNQIRERLEDECDWRCLQQTYTVTIAANTNCVAISGSNERSRILRVSARNAGGYCSSSYFQRPILGVDAQVPLVFDITQPSSPQALAEMSIGMLNYNNTAQANLTANVPTAFAIGQANADNGAGGEGEAWLYVYPTPSTARTIQLTMITPELTYEPTDVNRNIYIPTVPIVKGLQWMAREERGEELGANSLYSQDQFDCAVNDAVSREVMAQGGSADLLIE